MWGYKEGSKLNQIKKAISLKSKNDNFSTNTAALHSQNLLNQPSCCLNSRGGSSFDWSRFSSPSLLPSLGATPGAAPTAGAASLDPICWWIRVSCSEFCSTGLFSELESVLSPGVSGDAEATSWLKQTGLRLLLVLTGATGWLSLPCAVAPDLSEDWLRFSAT